LSGQSIKDEGCKVISSALEKMPNLKALNLFNNNISADGIIYLSNGIYPNLEYLNLCFNEIGSDGVKNLLKKSSNNNSEEYPKQTFYKKFQNKKPIEEDNYQWPKLKEIHLNKTGFDYKSILEIAPILRRLEHLDIGYLEEFDKRDHTMGLILLSLSDIDFSKLKILNIQRNNICPVGVKLLTDVKLDNLEKLWADNNPIGDEGLSILISKKWPSLLVLDIRHSGLTLESLSILEDQKYNLPKSPIVKIEDNPVSEQKGAIKAFHKMGWPIEKVAEELKLTIGAIKIAFPEIEWKVQGPRLKDNRSEF